jgi:hypothetical protein
MAWYGAALPKGKLEGEVRSGVSVERNDPPQVAGSDVFTVKPYVISVPHAGQDKDGDRGLNKGDDDCGRH